MFLGRLTAALLGLLGVAAAGCCCQRPCASPQPTAEPPQTRGLYAIARDRLYETTDGGMTWTRGGSVAASGLPGAPVPTRQTAGLYESRDNGKSWLIVEPTSGLWRSPR